MDCTDIKVLLSGLVDDTIDTTARYDAERHLAECASCRTLIDDAEALGTLISTDAEASVGSIELSDEFFGAVLARTVYADANHRSLHGGWVNWMGWLAAAACLTLAVTLWVMRMPSPVTPSDVATNEVTTSNGVVQTGYRPFGFSRVLEGDVSPLTLGLPGRTPAYDMSTPTAPAPSDDDRAQPVTTTPAIAAVEPSLTRADADALDTASYLMDLLLFADKTSFADVERIREMTETDDLLPRLALAREHMSPFDRPAIFAVEGVLLRVTRGPLSSDDLQELRDAVADADLAGRLSSMSERWYGADSI